jgi:hypothetical protein
MSIVMLAQRAIHAEHEAINAVPRVRTRMWSRGSGARSLFADTRDGIEVWNQTQKAQTLRLLGLPAGETHERGSAYGTRLLAFRPVQRSP